MDKILIQAWRCEALIGVYAWERQNKQPLYLDLELEADLSPAAASDQLSDALDYQSLLNGLRAHIANTEFQLLEALAQSCCDWIIDHYAVHSVRLRLHKPNAIAAARSIAIELYRSHDCFRTKTSP